MPFQRAAFALVLAITAAACGGAETSPSSSSNNPSTATGNTSGSGAAPQLPACTCASGESCIRYFDGHLRYMMPQCRKVSAACANDCRSGGKACVQDVCANVPDAGTEPWSICDSIKEPVPSMGLGPGELACTGH
jgi:hypothetical protein